MSRRAPGAPRRSIGTRNDLSLCATNPRFPTLEIVFVEQEWTVADNRTNRVTRKMVNDALRARGRDESLYPGDGYFYFGGGDAVHWFSSSVMVKRISDLTLEQWLVEFNSLLEREKKLRSQMAPANEQKPNAKQSRARSKARRKRA